MINLSCLFTCRVRKSYIIYINFLLIATFCHCGTIKFDNDPRVILPDDPVGDIDYSPAWSPVGDWIAFRHGPSSRQGSGVYIINSNGFDEALIVPDGRNPNWSFDGSKLVLNILGSNQFFSFDSSSNSIAQLTDDTMVKHDPSWRPALEEILFTVISPDSSVGVWRYNITSNEYFHVTAIAGKQPRWDTQGSRIVFYRSTGYETYLSILDVTTGSIINLIKEEDITDGHIRYPSFNPDGSLIAFNTTETPGNEAIIWIYNIQTKAINKIVEGGNSPSWSSDGNNLVFVKHIIHYGNVNGNGLLWVINIPTNNLIQLTFQ